MGWEYCIKANVIHSDEGVLQVVLILYWFLESGISFRMVCNGVQLSNGTS